MWNPWATVASPYNMPGTFQPPLPTQTPPPPAGNYAMSYPPPLPSRPAMPAQTPFIGPLLPNGAMHQNPMNAYNPSAPSAFYPTNYTLEQQYAWQQQYQQQWQQYQKDYAKWHQQYGEQVSPLNTCIPSIVTELFALPWIV